MEAMRMLINREIALQGVEREREIIPHTPYSLARYISLSFATLSICVTAFGFLFIAVLFFGKEI